MQIDYYAYRSGLRQWNAGVKAVLAVGSLLLILGFDNMWAALAGLCMTSGITLLLGKTPWKVYGRLLLLPFAFLIFGCVAIAVEFAGSPAGEWNLNAGFFWICMSGEGLRQAGYVFLKSMAGMSALFMLSLSTPAAELIGVLQKCRLPGVLIELMHLIYRYLFILLDVALQLDTASKARLGDRSFVQSCRSFAMIAGNVFLISLKKGNQYYDALLARGYEGRLAFWTEEALVTRRQRLFVVLYFAVLVLAGTAGGMI